MTPNWQLWRSLTRVIQIYELSSSKIYDYLDDLLSNEGREIFLFNSRRKNKFAISLHDFRTFVRGDDTIYRMQVVYSYALLESFAFNVIDAKFSTTITKGGGIESWGFGLGQALSIDMPRLFGGKEALVDGAIVRNIIAHGGERYAQSDMNRFLNCGFAVPPWQVGDSISIDYERARKIGAAFKALLREIQHHL